MTLWEPFVLYGQSGEGVFHGLNRTPSTSLPKKLKRFVFRPHSRSQKALENREKLFSKTVGVLRIQGELGKGYENYPSSVPASFKKEPWRGRLPLFASEKTGVYTSDYGWRGLEGRRDFHGGVDIKANAGEPVYALYPGKVVYLRGGRYEGGVVVKYKTLTFSYWHIAPSSRLKVGQQLKVGAYVGRLYSAGAKTHLHFAVHQPRQGLWENRRDLSSIDPFDIKGWPRPKTRKESKASEESLKK